MGIDAEPVEGVIAGCVNQVGEQSNNIDRNAWLQPALPARSDGELGVGHDVHRRRERHGTLIQRL